MKRIYPNLSLIGVNSMLNLLSFDVRLKRLNDRAISIEKSRHIEKIIMLLMDNSWDTQMEKFDWSTIFIQENFQYQVINAFIIILFYVFAYITNWDIYTLSQQLLAVIF